MCPVQTRFSSSNLSDSVGGDSSIYNKSLPAMLERIGQLVFQEGLANNAISATKSADFFWFTYLGLEWIGT